MNQIDISKYSVLELKGLLFDVLSQQQQINQNANVIREAIETRLKQEQAQAEVPTIPTELVK